MAKLNSEVLGKLGLSPRSGLLSQALQEAASGYTLESLMLKKQGAQIAHTLFESHAISLHQFVTANWLRLLVDEFSPFGLKLKRVPLLQNGKPSSAFERLRRGVGYPTKPLSPDDKEKLAGLITSLPLSEQWFWEVEIDRWDEYVKTLNASEINLLSQALAQLRKVINFDHPNQDSKKAVLRLPSMGLLSAYMEAFSQLELDVQPMYSLLESLDVVRVLHANKRIVAIPHPALNLAYEAHSNTLRPFIFFIHDILHFVGGHQYFQYDNAGLKTLLHFYELARGFSEPANRLWNSKASSIANQAWHDFESAVGAKQAKELWKEWLEKFETEIGDLVIYSSSRTSNPRGVILHYLIRNNPLDEMEVNLFASQLFLTHLWFAPELWQQLGVSGRQEALVLQFLLESIESPYPDVQFKAKGLHSFIRQALAGAP